MRMLFVNHTSRMGGAEYSLLEVLRRLPDYGIEAVVTVPAGAFAEALSAAGIAVECLPLHAPGRPRTLTGLGRGLVAVVTDTLRLHRTIRRLQPLLVHANSAKSAFPAALAARSLGIPCVWHCRDLRPPGSRLLIRLCHRVVAISQTVARSLPASPKVAVIANGIDLERFDPARMSQHEARGALGIPVGTPLVLMVADIIPWKRHDLFLEAAAQVHRKRPMVQFAVAGGDRGEHPELLARLKVQTAALGLTGVVRWLGPCPDIVPWLAAADVLLHPAGDEPFGRVVCEALALECRVVVADSGGAAEIATGCRQSARRVRRDDPRAFAEAVLVSLEESAGTSGAGDGRAHVASRYNVQRTAGELAVLLRRLARHP